MGLDVGGFTDRPDWPKLGPALLIATCLIVAIRTAKWAASADKTTSGRELEQEIDFAAQVAGRVLARLMRANEVMFPQKRSRRTGRMGKMNRNDFTVCDKHHIRTTRASVTLSNR